MYFLKSPFMFLNFLWLVILQFSVHPTMSFPNNDNFTSLLQFLSLTFLLLIILDSTSKTVANNNSDNGLTYLVPNPTFQKML